MQYENYFIDLLHKPNIMLYKSFIHCIASISFCMIIIDEVYYRLKRYDKRKKVFEKPVEYIDNLFETVDSFDVKNYVESPVDIFNEPTELGYNN